jgi:hypothetical protein
MLSDFFTINLPYGMAKNNNGKWFFFNREYVPLGWNSSINKHKYHEMNLPIYTDYKGLAETELLKLASGVENAIVRDENGKIEKVFFYNDKINPQNDAKYWPQYFEKIKLLSKYNIANREFSF